MAAAATLPGAAQAETKRYFSHTAVCGGEAEILSLSPGPTPYRICRSDGQCQSAQLYRYQVRCQDGRVYGGPEVYRPTHSKPDQLRVNGDRLEVAVGSRDVDTRRCDPGLSPQFCQQIRPMYGRNEVIWEPFPAGYAPLPIGASIIERGPPGAPEAEQRPLAFFMWLHDHPWVFLLTAALVFFWGYLVRMGLYDDPAERGAFARARWGLLALPLLAAYIAPAEAELPATWRQPVDVKKFAEAVRPDPAVLTTPPPAYQSHNLARKAEALKERMEADTELAEEVIRRERARAAAADSQKS